jgi:peptidyl-prolyl cis-trans isomerase D
MITWMQRHKKWLVSTIWVSTIAFVGAGFVGWGSYDYGKSDNAVAKVDDTEIPLNDLQSEYSALYSQYSQMFGNNFNQEMAKQFGLEDAAFQKVIQKYLLLNYAQDLGLTVTDDEVAKELLKIEAFKKDGKFDKNTYLSVLKQNRKSAVDFEEQLKKDLLVTKMLKIFSAKPMKQEIENIAKLLFIEDKVSVQVINGENIKVSASKDELKKFYDENKNNYKSPAGYKVAYTIIENQKDKDQKAMKKVALKEYLALKKGESKFTVNDTLYETTQFLSAEDFQTLVKSNPNDILKPFYVNNKYYVFKFVGKEEPKTLAYNEVSTQIKADLLNRKKADLLKDKVAKAKENFKGRDIGYISQDSKPAVQGLEDAEIQQLVQEIFKSTTPVSDITLGSKAVVFKIEDSRFTTLNKEKVDMIQSTVSNIKNNEISQNLLTQLQNKYEVKSFMGNK